MKQLQLTDFKIAKCFDNFERVKEYIESQNRCTYKTFLERWNKEVGIDLRVARKIYLQDKIERLAS